MKRRTFLGGIAASAATFYVSGTVSAREFMLETWYRFSVGSKVKGAPHELVAPTIRSIPHGIGIRFLVIGDWGTGAKSQAALARNMVETAADYGCDYVLSTGDNIYPKGVISADDSQWKRKFVDIYNGQGLTQTFFPTLGNHDYGFDPQAQIDYSGRNPQWHFPSRYYTKHLEAPDGTTAQIFSLDTQRVQTHADGAAEEQREWLDRELAKSSARWKIVFGHHMLYSNGAYGNLKRIRDAFEDVLIRRKADIYLCGHDHDLQVLKPVGGVHYVVSGGAGGHRDTSWKKNTLYAATNMGYVWLGATKEALYLHCHDASGQVKFGYQVA